MSWDKQIPLKLILANSKNFDDMFNSIHSPVDVDHLIAEKIAYANSQKTKNLIKDIHNNDDGTNSQNKHASYEMTNICSTHDSASYETVDSNTCSTQGSVNSEMVEFDTSLYYVVSETLICI